MAKVAGFAVATVILLGGLSACGGSSSSSTSAANQPASTPGTTTSASKPSSTGAATTSASIAADPSGMLKYNTTSLTVKAGTDKFSFTNKASLAHNFTIQGSNGKVIGATPTFSGSTKTLTVKLKPGTYTFYCSVPGHRQAGMQGTLTVK